MNIDMIAIVIAIIFLIIFYRIYQKLVKLCDRYDVSLVITGVFFMLLALGLAYIFTVFIVPDVILSLASGIVIGLLFSGGFMFRGLLDRS